MKDDNRSNLKNGAKSFARLLKYMRGSNKVAWFFVIVCILVSAFAQMQGMVFIQSLVDDYIEPMLVSGSRDFSGLAEALIKVAGIYVVGILASFTYTRIMVNVSQGTMKKLRTDLFSNMEKLPIKYFDTHPHGDIMSVYTNDIDTMRQLISQSIPQIINSMVTLIFSLVAMIRMNLVLAGITVLMACVMLIVTRKFSSRSGKYFDKQQRALGEVDGFIEEMLDGQKVVKIFCHEEKAMDDFAKINEQLRFSSYKANKYANMMMPVNVNIGNLSYVLCAAVGAAMALGVGSGTGIAGATVGTVVAFMGLNKSFSQPIAQISQQMNSIVMAVAGTKRVFALFDEKPEEDHGYVEMVNAIENEDGSLTETDHRTGVWAWKHPHQADGSVTYKKLQGEVVFNGVDFGYNDDKMVLHDIKLYAEPGQKIAFVGSTGAGKTTTIRILMDVFRANSGSITVDGRPFHPRNFRIGYLPEERGLYPKKGVQEQLMYLAQLRGSSRADAKEQSMRWLKRLGVEEYAQRKLETLSKGNQQKVQLAQTLVCDPELVILDEPFSGLDPVNSQILKDVIQEQIEEGKLVIFSSHQMSYVEEFCEDIVLINHGDIVLSGNLDQIKREYGRNRLVIGLGPDYQEPEQVLRDYMGDLLRIVGSRKDQVIAEMKEGCTREFLLREFLERKLIPEEFGNYEPSLTEIFVEKAGDQA